MTSWVAEKEQKIEKRKQFRQNNKKQNTYINKILRNVPKDKLKQLGITKKSLKQDFNLNKIKDIFDKNGIKF